MDKFLNIFGLVTIVALAASLANEAPASRSREPQLAPEFAAEVANGIAQQGNEAVRQIRRDAGKAVRLAKPADLHELAGIATEIAAK